MAHFAPLAPDGFRQPLCPYEPRRRPFNFYTQPAPAALVLRAGHYARVYAPPWEELQELEEGVSWFSEGREYEIDSSTAAALAADGYGNYIS